MAEVPQIKLNDGRSIPQLGLGVWQVEPEDTARVVSDALNVGYRHIDTAEGYSNEEGVGQAIAQSGIDRAQLFITSKLRNGGHSRDAVLKNFDDTMSKLGLDVLDLFLIHWPVPAQDKYVEAWKAFAELRGQGRVRSIGVSNFNHDHLERIIGETGVVPAVNQIELHPYFQQRDKRAFHKEKGIAIECYSPLGSGAVIKDETIAAIGRRYGKSVAQVIIRWHLDQGLIVFPKTTRKERMEDNFDVFDFALSDDDRKAINGLDKPDGRVGNDPVTNNDTW